jgi:hypothetical protein
MGNHRFWAVRPLLYPEVGPENAKKLGQFAGLDAIVIGTITPLSGTIRVTVKVLATDSPKLLAATSADIPKTNSIRDVMGEPEIAESTPTPQVQRTEAPVEQPTPTPVLEKVDPSMEWVIKINAALDRHDWRWITQFTVDGHTNYFSHRKVSNQFIANEIANDDRRYLREILPITSTPSLTRFPMNIHQLGLDQCYMIPSRSIPLCKNVMDAGMKQLPASQ